jgi:ATP-dependent DNA helicase RecG
MDTAMQLIWLRSDLRQHDNTALAAAAARGPTVAVYLLSPQQWLEHDDAACKVDFWLRNLRELSAALGELKVGLIHGRMKPAEKAAVMAEFKAGNLQLLVATTVIEVGVDVPNASLMIIENPERLGLAQLHQLRGRVGRGSAVSHCVLLYHPPLSQIGRQRLGIMRETNDGFVIAEKDLELRGPGEMLGTRQTGLLQFKVADLMRDADLLPAVRDAAQALLERWPTHVSPLLDRWLRHGQQYGQV